MVDAEALEATVARPSGNHMNSFSPDLHRCTSDFLAVAWRPETLRAGFVPTDVGFIILFFMYKGASQAAKAISQYTPSCIVPRRHPQRMAGAIACEKTSVQVG